jgi:pyrroloquinoline quinone (PQQ) biosynthesis protein C
MAATNYAIEGATGEWATLVCSQPHYENLFQSGVRKKAMKWLRLHAEYDDTHPWEALGADKKAGYAGFCCLGWVVLIATGPTSRES